MRAVSVEEFTRYLERLHKSAETDEIYLMSIDEYMRYRERIPTVRCWWWLRSPGSDQHSAAYVCGDGSADIRGEAVSHEDDGVRPVLRIGETAVEPALGSRLVRHDFPWIYIGDGLAIAEVPIEFRRFDPDSNVYESSEIRRWLLDWRRGR